MLLGLDFNRQVTNGNCSSWADLLTQLVLESFSPSAPFGTSPPDSL